MPLGIGGLGVYPLGDNPPFGSSSGQLTYAEWSVSGTIQVKTHGEATWQIAPFGFIGTGVLSLLPVVPVFSGFRRHSGADYAAAFLDLFPQGLAWWRDNIDSVFWRAIRGLGQIWGSPGVDDESDILGEQWVDRRAADLLERESDPRKTIELLSDWERNWGLPDPCYAEPVTVAERQQALVQRMTLEGGQSRAFFIKVAKDIGYSINIREYSPFMAGVSQVGDTRNLDDDVNPNNYRWEIGPPEMRFYWVVSLDTAKLIWFRASSGQAGIDPHLRIGIATDLECLLRRWKPAHTDIVFDYSGLVSQGPFAGTP
jgi:uncharacterized protein YmfQ (DUF2313 family)